MTGRGEGVVSPPDWDDDVLAGSPEAAPGPVGGPAPTERRFVRANLFVASGTALSRITGLLRLAALAYALGTTVLADSYNLANTAPNIVYELLLGGVLSAALVPMFAGHVERRDPEATRAVVGTSVTALVALTAVAVLLAPVFVSLYVPSSDPAYGDTVFLTRLLFPQILFYGLTALGSALLNARRSFFAPAWAPVLNNLVAIVVFVWVARILGGGSLDAADRTSVLLLLGVGSTLGIVVMAAALWPDLVKTRSPMSLRPRWRHPEVKRLLHLSAWTFGYVAANQIAVLVVYRLAWREGQGSLSTYLYSYQFFILPHGLIAVTLVTTLAPELGRAHVRGDRSGFARLAVFGLEVVALLSVPATIAYLTVGRPLLSLVLERGVLGASSVEGLGSALAAFAVGLVPFSLYLFALRCFYARGDARTPFIVNVVENAANLVLAFALAPSLGVEGLALSFALAYVVGAALALGWLARTLPAGAVHRFARSLDRIVLAGIVGGVGAWAGAHLGSQSGAGALLAVAGALVLGGAGYLGTLIALARAFPHPRPPSPAPSPS